MERMKAQNRKLYKENRPKFKQTDAKVVELEGRKLGRFLPSWIEVAEYAKAHRQAILVGALSILLLWQWHVATLATQRADKAERDMELNAQQAIQLSDAVLNAQASRDRLERKISAYALPPAK